MPAENYRIIHRVDGWSVKVFIREKIIQDRLEYEPRKFEIAKRLICQAFQSEGPKQYQDWPGYGNVSVDDLYPLLDIRPITNRSKP